MGGLLHLAPIPKIHEQINGAPECGEAFGKTAGLAMQARQIVTEFGILRVN
jgi:hypothetical protein